MAASPVGLLDQQRTIAGFMLGLVLHAAVPAVGRAGNIPLFCGVFCLILTMYGGGFAAAAGRA
jgi:hypothetical protein